MEKKQQTTKIHEKSFPGGKVLKLGVYRRYFIFLVSMLASFNAELSVNFELYLKITVLKIHVYLSDLPHIRNLFAFKNVHVKSLNLS